MKHDKSIGYYQGILQLRNPTPELIDFVKNDAKKNHGIIAKQKKVANGYDFYMASNTYLQSIGRKINNQFSGEFKISNRLFARDRLTGRLVYRGTIMFRMPCFKTGDIIKVRRRYVKVEKLGKIFIGKDCETGAKVSFKFRDIG